MLKRSMIQKLSSTVAGLPVLIFTVLAANPTTVLAAAYVNATITFVQSPTPAADCLYFQLSGVTQADPIAPNNAWFAIPSSQNGYSGIYAMIIAAKMASAPVSVITTGALAGGTCGTFAGIDHIAFD
jgi:hypothetical protein